jgi:hypothetical protein
LHFLPAITATLVVLLLVMYSEVFGAGMAAAISTYTYHSRSERDFGNLADVWITQMGWDVGTYMVKEFWPDLRRKHHESPPQNCFAVFRIRTIANPG